AAPLPEGEDLELTTTALHAEHRCARALERFALTLEASGEAHANAADALRGLPGAPTPVALELAWETAGVPYAYRLTTRYEIPCVVAGEIRLGDEVLELAGAPGQRDHSWGVRDWWAMDWMWSAAHLDAGTRMTAVQLRLRNAPPR